MSKPKLLITGGGYANIPLIQSAQELGYFVITTGYYETELGHQYSDLYEPADFSNNEEMLALAQRNTIAAICSSCNDFAAISSAYVAEKLSLPGHDSYENTLIIHHKDRFREFCLTNNLSVPKAKGFATELEAISSIDTFQFPIIVKPIDLTGGKGISLVHSKEEYSIAIKKAFAISKAKKIVIEEFIEGTAHGFSALIKGGKVTFYFTDDEYYQPNEFWVSGTSTLGTISENEITQLIDFSEKTVKLLGLCDGLFHIQCIIKKGQVFIIEVCRRPPGDLYLTFIKHATGFDYSKAIVQFVTGSMNEPITQIEPTGFYARHCISSLRKGYINNIIFKDSIKKNLIEEFRLWKPEHYVDNYIAQKAAILFMKFKTREEMIQISNDLYQYIDFECS